MVVYNEENSVKVKRKEEKIMTEKEIIYFELNNWFPGEHYPDEEPFTTWMGNDLCLAFNNEDWVIENELCVVTSTIDMSTNFCITATKDWVLENCPRLLTEHTKFLREKEEDEDYVYGQFDDQFLEYDEANFGIHYVDEDWC